MKACVIFDSRFGNTGTVARSIVAGLRRAGIDAAAVNTKEVKADASLEQYDLLCFGAPTEAFTASRPMKDLLQKLRGVDLSGRRGFAFETRVDWRLSGSAAKFIEKWLTGQGLLIIAPCESAIVSVLRERGQIVGATLVGGEEERFERIGARLGAGVLAEEEDAIQASAP